MGPSLHFGARSVSIRSFLTRRNYMNGRVLSFVAVLVTGGFFVARGAFSQSTASATRRGISLPDDKAQLPFSGGILAGNTLYLCVLGTNLQIGWDVGVSHQGRRKRRSGRRRRDDGRRGLQLLLT